MNKEKVKQLENKYQCCCDLDNYVPEESTGHSIVCAIHILATGRKCTTDYHHYKLREK